MDKGKGVNQFQRTRLLHDQIRVLPHRLGRGKCQCRPDPLSPGKEAISHGLMKGLRICRRGRQQAIEAGIDQLALHFKIRFWLHRHLVPYRFIVRQLSAGRR
jgi:hypothetical protein